MAQDAAAATVAVLGYGHQGEAHALNLRDSGRSVIVGARPGGEAESRARRARFAVAPLPDAAAAADVVACLLPDDAFPAVFDAELRRSLRPRATLVFAHGFNLLYRPPALRPEWDAVLVSPTGPGDAVRASYGRGGIPCYLAVHQDGSGHAWERAEAYAVALGSARMLRTTIREETEVDLFGEQAVLCGGMNALVMTAFDTLVRAGYAPEMAYLECVNQLAYLARALQERGVAGLRRSISATALFGDLTRGPRVLGEEGGRRFAAILDEVRDGTFAREWMAESARGAPLLREGLERSAGEAIEEAYRKLSR